MSGPNSRLWALIREIEDGLANLTIAQEGREIIEKLALFEASYDDIHLEAVKMEPGLKTLRLQLKRLRDKVEEMASNDH